MMYMPFPLEPPVGRVESAERDGSGNLPDPLQGDFENPKSPS